MDTVNFGRALYYPHIFPQSREWLRTSALYHDGISRIVPRDFVPSHYDRHNGDDLLHDFEALRDAGFIEDKYPNEYLSDVGAKFLDYIAPYLQEGRKDRLIKELSSKSWKPYNMYREKILPELVELLEHEGLVKRVNPNEIEFDASIGGLYMLFLAREMAKHLPIVSDNPTYEALSQVQFNQKTVGASTDRGSLLANAIFQSAVPIDIENVPIADLISFRNDHEGERRAFYDWIASFSADLSKITDSKQLEQAVEHHAAEVDRRMSALRTKLLALKLKCAQGIFSFSVPGLLTADWGLHIHDPRVIVGGAILTVGGVVTNSVLDGFIARADSPLSYVHSMKKGLQTKRYTEQLIALKLSSGLPQPFSLITQREPPLR